MIDFGLIFHIVIPVKACPQPDWGRESRTRGNSPGFRVFITLNSEWQEGYVIVKSLTTPLDLCVFEFRFVLLNTFFALLPESSRLHNGALYAAFLGNVPVKTLLKFQALFFKLPGASSRQLYESNPLCCWAKFRQFSEYRQIHSFG